MENINVTNARKDLYRLINRVQEIHEPVKITGKTANVVLLSEKDWNAVSFQHFRHDGQHPCRSKRVTGSGHQRGGPKLECIKRSLPNRQSRTLKS